MIFFFRIKKNCDFKQIQVDIDIQKMKKKIKKKKKEGEEKSSVLIRRVELYKV